MIKFDNVTKYFEHRGRKKYILKDASCVIPSGKNLVVLGEDGTGKSVFINLMNSASFPNSGKITADETISWPITHKGTLINNMTGKENVEIVSMFMNLDRNKIKEIHEFVADFTELGKDYSIELKTYSKSMRARLSFAMCFAFEFDTYLLDDFSFNSDSILAEKAEKFIAEKRKNSRFIIATKSLKRIQEDCDCAVLIKDNKLIYYDNINAAVEECKKMFKNVSELFSDDFDAGEDSGD